MSDSNSPRGEQEQQENQLNSSSTMSSISENLDPAHLGITMADLDDGVDVYVDVVGGSEPEDLGLTKDEIMAVMCTGDVPQGGHGDLSDIWPGPTDLTVYAPVPVNSSRILAVPPEAWYPPDHTSDDENWLYDFKESSKDEVDDSDSKAVPLKIVSVFFFFLCFLFYFYIFYLFI